MCAVLSLSLVTVPFVAAYQAVTYPITATLELAESLIGDLGLDESSLSSEDLDTVIEMIYQSDKYHDLIDSTVSQYDSSNVTYINVLKIIIYAQCSDISESTLKKAADFISENMAEGFDNDQAISFILSTSPFSESAENAGLDEEQLYYLFYGYTSDDESDSSDQAIDSNLETGEKIVAYAKTKLGCRYYWGASGPKYFDCSGLVYWCHRQAGISIGRLTASGYSQSGKAVSYSSLQPGDVITFNYGSGVAHIGIYIGNQQMIHASGQGSDTVGQYANQCVKITSIAEGSYFYRYIYNCRRLY